MTRLIRLIACPLIAGFIISLSTGPAVVNASNLDVVELGINFFRGPVQFRPARTQLWSDVNDTNLTVPSRGDIRTKSGGILELTVSGNVSLRLHEFTGISYNFISAKEPFIKLYTGGIRVQTKSSDTGFSSQLTIRGPQGEILFDGTRIGLVSIQKNRTDVAVEAGKIRLRTDRENQEVSAKSLVEIDYNTDFDYSYIRRKSNISAEYRMFWKYNQMLRDKEYIKRKINRLDSRFSSGNESGTFFLEDLRTRHREFVKKFNTVKNKYQNARYTKNTDKRMKYFRTQMRVMDEYRRNQINTTTPTSQSEDPFQKLREKYKSN